MPKTVIICLYLGFAIVFEIISECVVVYFGLEKRCEDHPLHLVNEVAKCRGNHLGEVLS
jgi:hypothetical protein